MYISGSMMTFENRMHQGAVDGASLVSFIIEGNSYLNMNPTPITTQQSGKWEREARMCSFRMSGYGTSGTGLITQQFNAFMVAYFIPYFNSGSGANTSFGAQNASVFFSSTESHDYVVSNLIPSGSHIHVNFSWNADPSQSPQVSVMSTDTSFNSTSSYTYFSPQGVGSDSVAIDYIATGDGYLKFLVGSSDQGASYYTYMTLLS